MSKRGSMTREIRFYVSNDVHRWLKKHTIKRGSNIAVYTRTLIEKDRDLHCCRRRGERSDVLIESMAEKLDAISEKLGVEVPETEPDSEAEKGGEK